ncbi:MAG: diaminopimelate decarboxylase family protein [Candidatus Hermodarchaeota archaeon]
MKIISGNPYLVKSDGKILIDSVPLDDIIREYKTPLLIFMEERIRDNIRSFLNFFKEEFDNFRCFYSLKANYLSEICKIVCSEGIGVKAIGMPELKLALNLGFSPDKIIVGGPYLPDELIELSITNRVKEIIIYSIKDLKRINTIAQKFNIVQNICIRVNSQKYQSKLGIEFNKSRIKSLKESLLLYKNIKLTSLLSHFSTQMNNIEQFEKNIKNVIFNLKILLENKIPIENINLGGGFPEATVMKQGQLKKIAKYIKEIFKKSNLSLPNISFEPGRYFVGDSGLYLSKIIRVNEDRWIFLDIGNHICPKFARCSLRFYNASQIDKPHKYKTSIAGIVPTDQDVLAKNYFFTEDLREEDNIIITNVGAYCLTFSNRFPYTLPSIILVKGNLVKKIFDPTLNKDFSLN